MILILLTVAAVVYLGTRPRKSDPIAYIDNEFEFDYFNKKYPTNDSIPENIDPFFPYDPIK